MRVKESQEGDITILTLSGGVDTQGARKLEQVTRQLIGDGRRRFVIDLRQVELLAPSGLRVFRVVSQMLKEDGGLVLCSPGGHIMNVIEISGLSGQFIIASTRKEALGKLTTSSDISPLTAMVGKIMGVEAAARSRRRGERSELAQEVARALRDSPRRGPGVPAPETGDPGQD